MLEHAEAYIFEKLDLASSQAASGKIRSSKAGFLKSAIEEDYHNENAVKKKIESVTQGAKQAREKLERELEALKAAQREAETSYRGYVAEIIEDAFQSLPEAQRDAASKEFQASLGSTIYVNAFKKGGWKDRLTFQDSIKFWEARGLALPSPADWAQKKGSQEPDAIKAKMQALEEQLKKPVILVKPK